MKFETVTIKDIAKALGISTSTVSRALRGSHEINEETKQMVQAYADRMQYQPNPIARSLKESSSKAIGVIVPEIDNTFFAQALTGIDAFAHQRGYHVVIFQSFESYDREIRNAQQLVSRRVDGLLVSLSSQTNDLSHFRMLQERGLPIVFFDRVPESLEAHTVTANNFQGTYEAVRHLLAQGRRRIAHITSKPWLSTTKERLAGHQAALREQGLPFDESYAKYCANGGMVAAEVEEAVKELLALPEPRTPSSRPATGSRMPRSWPCGRRGCASPRTWRWWASRTWPSPSCSSPPSAPSASPPARWARRPLSSSSG